MLPYFFTESHHNRTRTEKQSLISLCGREGVHRLWVDRSGELDRKRCEMSELLSIDRRTGEVIEPVADETEPDELDAICDAAEEAADGLPSLGLEGRAQLLEKMAQRLESNRRELIEVADRETALGSTRLEGELSRTAFQFRFLAGVIRDGALIEATIDHAKASEMGQLPDMRRMLIAVGPVAVFGASNFPFAFSVPGGDTASAIAAGCPVVVKAHPAHPATSRRCVEALRGAVNASGAPTGTIGLVHGLQVGVALVRHRSIRAVGFTGSQYAGRALFDVAAAREDPIPFYGELGSVNPVVVTPKAATERPEEIAQGFVASFTLSLGQFCTKPGLIFVPRAKESGPLRDAIRSLVEDLEPGVMLTADLTSGFQSGTDRFASFGEVVELARGKRSDEEAGLAVPRLFGVTAAELAGPGGETLRQECFGPVALVVEYSSEDELLAALGALDPALAAAIEIGDGEVELPSLVEARLVSRVGRLVVNGFTTGVGITWSTHHGGPYPSSTSELHSSVGASAVRRWLRPICYQSTPETLLPPELRDDNPLGLPRRVDGRYVAAP